MCRMQATDVPLAKTTPPWRETEVLPVERVAAPPKVATPAALQAAPLSWRGPTYEINVDKRDI